MNHDFLPLPERDSIWTTVGHTAVDVPLMAIGPGAERVSRRMDNTNVFEIMHVSLRWPPTVTLTPGEGFDPLRIFYTTDGTTPTNASTMYTAPLTFNTTTTLRFFAQDSQGIRSTVFNETYNIYRQVSYTYSVSVPVMRWVKRWYKSWFKSRGKGNFRWRSRWRSRWVRVRRHITEHRTGHRWELT